MIVGIPKELKNNEYRVAIVPSGVRSLVENGHKVIIHKGAGEGAGISDAEYLAAGASIRPNVESVFKEAEMVLKVKEPLPSEYGLLQSGQIIFTYLHLAPAPELTSALLERNVIAIAYETVQLSNGTLPLLTPMSEIAGKLSVQIGARYLEKENGGRGVLMGGVPGVRGAEVVIVGGGTVGINAAKVALGMGAHVTMIDISLDRLRYLDDVLSGNLTLLVSNTENIDIASMNADLLVGALLVAGAKARKVVTRQMVSRMKQGSVIVDVAIDQGGCVETSVATTFDNPVFLVDGVIHYCVTNMPGCVARTSTFALTNATSPYALKLANLGYKEALHEDLALRKGLNIFEGKLVNQPVADALGLEYTPYESLARLAIHQKGGPLNS
jgi:alanine dehydrogenase